MARWFWAMAQMAPLSEGEAIARPVEIWFCVFCSWVSVEVRFCRAIKAPGLLFTLTDISMASYSQVSSAFLRRAAVGPLI